LMDLILKIDFCAVLLVTVLVGFLVPRNRGTLGAAAKSALSRAAESSSLFR
jgi:hypothetical protein